MTRHTHTEDFAIDAPHPRVAIRTAEAMCDDIDAKLSRAKPRPENPTPAERAQGFADGIGFALLAVLVVFGLLSIGG